MLTAEGKVKQDVKKILDEMGVYWHMSVPTGYGRPTLDFLCCFKGRFFAIETKAEGGKVTPRQRETMYEIQKASGWTFVVFPSDVGTLKDRIEFMVYGR